MFVFILFIVLALAGIGFILKAIFGRKPDPEKYRGKDYGPVPRFIWGLIGGVLVFCSMLTIFFGGYTSVPARSLGIPVSFGKVQPALNPGFHWVWPWVTVAEISKTVHTITFKGQAATPFIGGSGGNISGSCLDVRIGGQQSACADVTLVYQVTDQGAPTLYLDYNGQGGDIMNTIASNLVVREEEQAINQVLGDYQPIQDVAATTKGKASQFSTFGPQLKTLMQNDLSGLVTVKAIILPFMHYDQSTQDRLNQIQAQYAQTAIATQQIATNQAQSLANAAIVKSAALSPAVLENECLTISEQALKNGDNSVQPGYCFLSSSSNALLNGKG